MKYIFTLVVLFTGIVVNAQCTVDPTPSTPGAYPSTLTQGCVNSPYSDTTTLVFKVDTVLFSFTLNMDSVEITSISNLPAGLSFSCGSGSCRSVCSPPQTTRNCVLFNGTPTSANTPNDTIDIVLTYYVTVPFVGVQTFPDTISVQLNIDACAGISAANILRPRIYPNPAQNQLFIEFSAEQLSTTHSIYLYNATGQLVYSQMISQSSTIVATGAFAEGVYYLQIESESETSGERIIIRR